MGRKRKCTQHQPLPLSPADNGAHKPRQGQQFCAVCFAKGKPTKIQLCGGCGAYHTTHNFGREAASCLARAQGLRHCERGGARADLGCGSPPTPRAFASSAASSASSGAEDSDAAAEEEEGWALPPLPPARRLPSVTRQTTLDKAEALLASARASAGAAAALLSPSLERSPAACGGGAFFQPLGLVASPPAVAALSLLANRSIGWHGRPFDYRPPSQLASDAEVVASLLALAANPGHAAHLSPAAARSPARPTTFGPAAVAAPKARPETRPEARGRPRARALLAGESAHQSAAPVRPSCSPARRHAGDASPRKKLRPALSPCAAPPQPGWPHRQAPGEGRGAAGSAFFHFKPTSVA